jgi:hypothetical protein
MQEGKDQRGHQLLDLASTGHATSVSVTPWQVVTAHSDISSLRNARAEVVDAVRRNANVKIVLKI